jgi:hypothetical protein
MQILTDVIAYIKVFCLCMDNSIDNVSKCAFIIADNQEMFIDLVIMVVIIILKSFHSCCSYVPFPNTINMLYISVL